MYTGWGEPVRGAVSVALITDWCLGEPPTRFHPTVWMGAFLRRARAHAHGLASARRDTSAVLRELAAGSAWVLLGLLLVCAASLVLTGLLAWVLAAAAVRSVGLPGLPRRDAGAPLDPVAALTHGVLLKPALAARSLLDATHAVQQALTMPDEHAGLVEARRQLAWHLVSRPTQDLRADEVAGAALASLAENFSDSIVAPLLAYRVAGLPGAYAYRFVNTADAMLGYRSTELEWFGKPAARLDDLCNLVPARVAGTALLLASVLCKASPRGAWRCLCHDARRTPSPNGGWPMAAMAGALGVVLDKRQTYTLNATGRAPTAHDLITGRRLVRMATLLVVVGIELSYLS